MISVIIPTYNEATYLPATLDSVADNNTNKEVIVVDAGSADGTSDLARARAARVLLSQRRQRAYQMNLGARHAYGTVLLFGKVTTLYPPVITSSRRFRRDGVVTKTLSDLWLTCRYLAGADPNALAGVRRSAFFEESPSVSDSGVKQQIPKP